MAFVVKVNCAVPENIHTHPMEGQWKFRWDQGGLKSQTFKRKYGAYLEFPYWWGDSNQKNLLSMEGVWTFSRTTHSWPHKTSVHKFDKSILIFFRQVQNSDRINLPGPDRTGSTQTSPGRIRSDQLGSTRIDKK